MAAVQDSLLEMLEPEVTGLGYELVHVEMVSVDESAVLRVYIDTASGVGLDDCAKVSRALSALLDVEDPIPGQYRLEVSSPGLDRPLVSAAHFRQFEGSLAKVRMMVPLDGRSNFRGRITGCDGEAVALDVDGQVFSLPLSEIEKARLVPEFN